LPMQQAAQNVLALRDNTSRSASEFLMVLWWKRWRLALRFTVARKIPKLSRLEREMNRLKK